jgi:small-conductance mechanosensitive channel
MALEAITATGSLVLAPLVQLWNSFIGVIPGIVAAIIILIVGYFVSLGIGHGIRVLVEKTKIDSKLEKSDMAKTTGHIRMSALLGEISKWYVFIIFLQAAVDILNLGTISNVLDKFVIWLPNVILAVLVVIFGIAIAHYIGMKTEQHTEVKGTKFLSKILKGVIIVMITVVALNQIGVNVSIIENTFLLLIGGLALGLAIALGLGVGNALKPESKDIVDSIKSAIKH